MQLVEDTYDLQQQVGGDARAQGTEYATGSHRRRDGPQSVRRDVARSAEQMHYQIHNRC